MIHEEAITIALIAIILIRNTYYSWFIMKRLKVVFVFFLLMFWLCSSSFSQKYPKVKVADGYVQIDRVGENKMYLEVTIYNGSTEYVRGLVTIMKAKNLSHNQEVIKITPGNTETVLFPKEDRNSIVTWEEIKLHDFTRTR